MEAHEFTDFFGYLYDLIFFFKKMDYLWGEKSQISRVDICLQHDGDDVTNEVSQ